MSLATTAEGQALRRIALVLGLELRASLRRPVLWILVLLLGFLMWGLSTGHARIESGDASVGGTKSFLTSQFAVGITLSIVIFLCYSFFIAVVAGMAVIRDDELKTGEILHATPLRPGEYVWGKFLAILASFLAVLGAHLVLMIVFNHVVPHPGTEEFRGPFVLMNYLRPAIVFGLPVIVFLAGTSFFVGERTRRPILVFFLPVALMLVCAFFLWNWSPTWLDPRINRVLVLIEPSGFRWINETWIKMDRGVEFYNSASIPFDAPFIASRLALLLAGFASVAWSQKGFAARLRGARKLRRRAVRDVLESRQAFAPELLAPAAPRRLASLGMGSGAPGLVGGIVEVARVELRELRSQPGLYLFVPMILLQTLGSSLLEVGAFDTPLLLTPGTLAVRMMNTLTLLVCLLLLFFTTESLQRERTAGLGSIAYAAPVRTASVLFGKAIANSVVGVAVLLASFVGSAVALLIQGKVSVALGPFLLVWGLLLLPTFLLWSAFVTAVYALTRNRYTTYGVALGALVLTGYLQFRGKMNWAGNWDLWSAVLWSDMGLFEIDRMALLLNRAAALGLTVFFTALGVRIFPRRELDGGRTVHRLSPPRLLQSALRMSPYALIPIVAVVALWIDVNRGFQGKTLEKREKDYWRQNLATWKDAPLPALEAVDLDLTLEPSKRWFRVRGSYDLGNRKAAPLRQVPLTGGPHWSKVGWTMNGQEAKPESRTGLYVFTPASPLAPGERLRIGFSYEGLFPPGITKNGGGAAEFILPSGVVLTSFSSSFVPVIGYMEEVGVDEEKNRYEPKVYPEDDYKRINEPAFVSGSTFTTRIRIDAPEAYTLNSVGSLASETVVNGRRVAVWESDAPVRFFNVVAGRWAVQRGPHTAIYYHPEHRYNVAEMSEALEGAYRYFSEWFHPFPWKELKVSEFPALATYAQGFPTNITFSEGIGFLTRSDPKAQAAFVVTAHEAAHQWWGSILTPGKGPGGNILSEGMAHFSTILLVDRIKGERERLEFCKRLEERYGDKRQADSERPLVKIDGSRPGDTTVTYDKGGWVVWMLTNLMGREAALSGLREFIDRFSEGPDYPLLQDLVETMRARAPDEASYDAFVKQWFFDVVVPEYRLGEAKRALLADPAPGGEKQWEVTVRVKNAGKGRMPIEVAAVSGERYAEDGSPSPDYRDARVPLVLGAGEAQEARIRCAFEPTRVIVDPDVKVLQLNRKGAVASF